MVRPWILYAGLAACAPELPDETSIVTTPRLLGVQLEPPEVAPQTAVATRALWVDADGVIADAPLAWAFCTARKGLTEPGPIASACLAETSDQLVPFGDGTTATGNVPPTACRQFGPDAPDPLPGEPAGRPVDPDSTGGFYQPIRVRASDPIESYILGEVRITCGLPSATPAQSMEFRERYVRNANPTIEAMVGTDGAALVTSETDASASSQVAAGSSIDLAAHWPACASAPCGGSEPYAWFDPRARVLVERREAMRVSWFASGGAFARGHSGRTEDDVATFATTTWTAPTTPGSHYVWIVLRDDRGGTTWATVRFAVE